MRPWVHCDGIRWDESFEHSWLCQNHADIFAEDLHDKRVTICLECYAASGGDYVPLNVVEGRIGDWLMPAMCRIMRQFQQGQLTEVVK